MNVKLSIFTLFILKVILIKAQIQSKDPDEDTSTADLIRNKGYLAEEYDVITKDGFIITIQRVVSPNFKNKSSKPVVFLQHGLLDASSTWVINFPSQSLGFILADKGFDVWLGNTRGNTHALHHTKYNKNEEIFWNFSFDEIALYDLPAMVNYILDKTNQSKLFYVGHSQGNMVAFARLSTCPEFNSKIKLFLALGIEF
jgi:pimeloyl-ACP methyl ester carboxylesterase